VVSQVALTLLLVTSSWGFVRSLYNLKHVDLGLQPDHLLQFSLAPALNGYDQVRSLELYRQLEERLGAVPGVASFSAAEEPLIADSDRGSDVTVQGTTADVAEAHVLWNGIGSGHFTNLRIPLLSGREFSRQDGPDTPKVVILNESMAKTFFPNGQAVGKRMKFGHGVGPLDREIVGVVKDSHHSDVKEKPVPFAYIPYSQETAIRSLTYYVRTTGDPLALATAVRRVVNDLDAGLPIYDVRTFEEQIDLRLSEDQLVAVLALVFGALAAMLAAMGIYGLLAHTVTQRTREIGVRMALGAAPTRIGRMMFNEVARLAGIGTVLGMPFAYGLGKLFSSLVYGVRIFGPASLSIALLALALVATLATYGPLRRATRIDPMVALRYE